MKSYLKSSIIAAIVFASISSYAQQSPPTAASYLQASLTAMVGQNTVQDVTLSGNAEVNPSENTQTLSSVFEAVLGGSTSIAINLPSGASTDMRILGTGAPSGTWSNGDGVQHPISGHNLMTDQAWFFPEMVVSRMISNTALTVLLVGQEGNLLHLQAYQQQPGATANVGPLLQHLSQMDLYLNSTTLLPAQLNFTIHPDGNASVDIPVVVQYSAYQTVNGISLPFHVQKYFNNSLAMDLQIQTAVFNSGITISAPSVQ